MHVFEDTIHVDGVLPKADRNRLLNKIIFGSASKAAAGGNSLALIRPRNTRFSYKRKTAAIVAKERERYARAAQQGSFFDAKLAALAPLTPCFSTSENEVVRTSHSIGWCRLSMKSIHLREWHSLLEISQVGLKLGSYSA